jgi:hypothetical protein
MAITMAAPAAAGAQTTVKVSPEQLRRYDKISIMEGTLTSSVSLAATQVARDVRSMTPTAQLFTGSARAKGFTLEGYGVFFYVEIPALDLSVMLTLDSLERDAQRRVGSQVSSRPDSQAAPVPSAVKDALRSVTDDDPGQKYRDAVKLALIDAMLDNSKNLELGPEEYLTIAARGSEFGLLPNEIYQLNTVVLRVKGSDLADFLAGRLTKDEARLKVEVRTF